MIKITLQINAEISYFNLKNALETLRSEHPELSIDSYNLEDAKMRMIDRFKPSLGQMIKVEYETLTEVIVGFGHCTYRNLTSDYCRYIFTMTVEKINKADKSWTNDSEEIVFTTNPNNECWDLNFELLNGVLPSPDVLLYPKDDAVLALKIGDLYMGAFVAMIEEFYVNGQPMRKVLSNQAKIYETTMPPTQTPS